MSSNPKWELPAGMVQLPEAIAARFVMRNGRELRTEYTQEEAEQIEACVQSLVELLEFLDAMCIRTPEYNAVVRRMAELWNSPDLTRETWQELSDEAGQVMDDIDHARTNWLLLGERRGWAEVGR